MKFPLQHLLIISTLVLGSLLLAACGGGEEEEPLSPTSTTVATPTVSADPEDFVEFAGVVSRAAEEQDTGFFADRVRGRGYTCTAADIGGEPWGIEQGLCQEVGQSVNVVEFGFWHSDSVLRRPAVLVKAIEDYFASALPGESDDYGPGAVQLYATGITRSSDPSLTYRAAILTAVTPVGEGAASKPVRTARGVNFQYVDSRWVITGILWADVLAEELLNAETAAYTDWTRLPAEVSTAGSAPGPKPAERQGESSVSNSPTPVATENEAVTGTQVQPPFRDDTAESVKVARQDLAQRLGVSVESVVADAVIGQEFSADAFYCRTTKDRIAKEDSPAVMTGSVILLNVSARRYEYHASGTTVIFCRPLP